MSVKEDYINLCEARIEALEKELKMMTDWICRDNLLLRELPRQVTLDQFECYKEGVREDENTRGGTQSR